ncbi:TadE/TadG family type IV pilus assembly protein [Massilia sp. YIM B02443]|uniref:TadE/TadG family type IV pilus assembly protein n=1 Tax=Massilia sp. YIM B02443 TaxID=3050127 RepID=UPI0025B6B118|nr:TadE family protein [Massilia sp. YIM B02443]MDN4037647.1 pilus assembly protein [Massilia sp. YIM B02443]
MWATDVKPTRHPHPHPRRRAQRGVASIEFALVAIAFLVTVFGILELGRIVYMFNTLSDVTRSAARSAANIDWRDAAALERARQRAMFRNAPGELAFGAPVTDANIRIDYLYVKKTGASFTTEPVASMPTCPSRNRHNCLTNHYGNGTDPGSVCVRLVRVRICEAGGADCQAMKYQPLFPMLNLTPYLPLSTTVVAAETLGYRPGDSVCP